MPPSTPWRSWRRSDWNDMLFAYCFDASETSAPRRRLPALLSDLCRVVGDAGVPEEDVLRAFVNAVWEDPATLNWKLSPDGAGLRPRSPETPACFAYLYLTCLVAAGGDEGVVRHNQFRDRLNEVMGGEARGYRSQLKLEGLGALWEQFAAWSQRWAPERGVRPVELTQGSYKLIGYTLRLAFPSRGDRLRLGKVLEPLRGFEPPPVEAVRRLLEHRLGEFSDDFQEQWTEFRKGLGRQGHSWAYAHPVWDAIRDGVRLGPQEPSARAPLTIVREPMPGGFGFIVLRRQDPSVPVPAGFEVQPFSVLGAGVDGIVVPLGSSPRGAAERLLGGGFGWPKVWSQPWGRIVREGVLVFAPTDDGLVTLQTSLPAAGAPLWLLVGGSAETELRRQAQLSFEASPYPGWKWAHVSDAGRLGREWQGSLRNATSLQRSVAPAVLRLRGGARTSEGAYLGRAGSLPEVVAPAGVVRVVVHPLSGEGSGVTLEVREVGVHRFARSSSLSGAYDLQGQDEAGGVLARARVRFVLEETTAAFLVPGALESYVVEGADDGAEPTTEYPAWVPPAPMARPRRRGCVVLPAKERGPTVVSVPEPGALNVETFVEVVAARASQRAGLPAVEVVGLAEAYLGLSFEGRGRSHAWDVLRTWEEAGAWDVLRSRRTGHEVFVPRPVRLWVCEARGGVNVVVDGWPTQWVAERLQRVGEGEGVLLELSPGGTPWAARRWRGLAATRGHVEALGRETGIPVDDVPPLACLPAGEGRGLGLTDVHERGPSRTWDWERGGFWQAERARAGVLNGVSVHRYDYPGGASTYGVRVGGRTREYETRTRALLDAHALAGRAAFAWTEAGLACTSGVHLPVPLARALVARTGLAPEVWPDASGGAHVYPCVDLQMRAALEQVLHGEWDGAGRSPHVPEWLVAQTMAAAASGAPLTYFRGASSLPSLRGGIPASVFGHLRARTPR